MTPTTLSPKDAAAIGATPFRTPALAVVIASLGRPLLLHSALQHVLNQSRPPDYLVAVGASQSDLPEKYRSAITGPVTQFMPLLAPVGSARQRNDAIRWLLSREQAHGEIGLVVFCDDDFVMSRTWLANVERDFREQPSLIGATGVVLADGVTNGGYTDRQALAILGAARSELPVGDWRLRPGRVKSLYGCNMVVRGSALRQVQFDEGLPLYGWLEDYDISARLAELGELKRLASLAGVHLGTKSGRTSERRFGYSQVANPIYLVRKGSMPVTFAIKMICKNFAANMAGSRSGQSACDRAGRLMGNLQALRDAVTGRVNPLNITKIAR